MKTCMFSLVNLFYTFSVAMFLVLACLGCGETGKCLGEPGVNWIEGEVVVHFTDADESEETARQIIEDQGLEIKEFIRTPRVVIVKVPAGAECRMSERLEKLKEVDFVTLCWIIRTLQ